MTACSPGGENASEPENAALVALFEQFRDSAENDFEREVFERAIENGGLTADDYEEAHSRYVECMEGLGFEETHTKQPNGLYTSEPVTWPEGEEEFNEYMDRSEECAIGTVAAIEAAYNMQLNNPEGREPSELIVDCLIDLGAVSADYTAEQFDEDFEASSESGFEDAPFDVGDPDVADCLAQGGIAIVGPESG
ncbi:hypothetical protein KIK06_18065 [Nocardiopsis sp. EMB25]|uniref:hypothetical protein n=1 Tax=Nocardiopsis TaxID=2013 RepID=UPI000345F465|nr:MULTISPECIES: hypothetical protein [Nocardiopsis]MCY9785797.1 hypothetical protein [Nocardiopsis sp. EMB25]